MVSLLALGLVLSTSAFAQEPPVVKIASFPCNRPSQTKFGSAVAFKKAEETYLLTSDHVLFHGNLAEGACHRVFESNLKDSKSAQVKAVNIGKGLALLLLEGGPLSQTTPLSYEAFAQPAEEAPEDFMQLCGFPYGSNQRFCDHNGQVLQPKSDRFLLPLLASVIEVNGHNEYGMSGGGVFSKDGALRGLISHQYLQLVAGGPTKLVESKEGMLSGELIALGIPRLFLTEWLQKYFAGKSDDLRLDASAQLRGKNQIVLSGVRFTPKECPPLLALAWGDPVGIGGGLSVEGNICDVVLSLEKDPSRNQSWPFAQRAWFQRAQEKLLAGGGAVITGLFYDGKKNPVQSLLNLLTQVARGVTPTVRLSDPFTEPTEISKELKALAPKIQAKGKLLKEIFYKDSALRELLEQVIQVGESCENEQFELVDLQDLKRLLTDALWKELLVSELDLTIELKGMLYKAQELLAKIQG